VLISTFRGGKEKNSRQKENYWCHYYHWLHVINEGAALNPNIQTKKLNVGKGGGGNLCNLNTGSRGRQKGVQEGSRKTLGGKQILGRPALPCRGFSLRLWKGYESLRGNNNLKPTQQEVHNRDECKLLPILSQYYRSDGRRYKRGAGVA